MTLLLLSSALAGSGVQAQAFPAGIDQLTGASFQRKVLKGTLATTAAALAALGGWYVYERSASEDLNSAIETAAKDIEAKNYAAARAELTSVVDRYGHARAAQTARDMLDRLGEFEKEENERRRVAEEAGRRLRTDLDAFIRESVTALRSAECLPA